MSRNGNTLDIANAAVEKLSTSMARAILEPSGHSHKPEGLLPLTSPFFLSGSPVPYLIRQTSDDITADPTQEHPLRTATISSIPRHIVDIMLKNYCDTYRRLYPAIEESDLYEACDRVCKNERASDFDFFCVYITLAISSHTLMHHDEKRATIASREFLAAAIVHLDQVGLENSWERLQALQLLAHYGFMDPGYVDSSRCAEVATRLCLQLGLHHELPASTRVGLDTKTINNRRRLFWNSYSIDSAVHTVRCQGFVFPISEITVKFPDAESQSSSTIHIWSLRKIEVEITLGLYYPSLVFENSSPNSSFSPWFMNINERLNDWYEKTRQSVNLSEKIEFHELMYQFQILRLNRPSPCCLNPTEDMKRKALKSSIALLKEFGIINRLGRLFNIWHATFVILESGIYLLASTLTGMESEGQNLTHLEGEDVTILMRYIKALPDLVWQISRRWPNITDHASTVESISLSVLEKLGEWSNGKAIERSDSDALKRKLNQASLFPPFPLQTQPLLERYILPYEIDEGITEKMAGSDYNFLQPDPTHPTLIRDILYSASDDNTATMKSNSAPENSEYQIPPTNTIPRGPSYIAPQPWSQNFLDEYDNEGRDVLAPDFAGMDYEEIFAALFDGEQMPLANDFPDII
ncbi:hypothetical protein F5884DRAFT_743739 [Xylogone sp. PMI_703]|nr:hypothetical protein F5884DRAFT_743739 [Xylogone sp. PMI_703]